MEQDTFQYIVVHEARSKKSTSLFQGFSYELIENSALYALILGNLPASLAELSVDRQSAIALRYFGMVNYSIFPLDIDALSHSIQMLKEKYPLIVLLSPTSLENRVRGIRGDTTHPILQFVSEPNLKYELSLAENTREEMWSYARTILKSCQNKTNQEKFDKIIESTKEYCRWEVQFLKDFQQKTHNCFSPNHLTLNSLGFIPQLPEHFFSENTDDWVNEILKSATPIANLRTHIELQSNTVPSPDLIIAAASVYKKHYTHTLKHRLSSEELAESGKLVRTVLKSLIRQGEYITTIKLPQNVSPDELMKNPVCNSLKSERGDEMSMFTAAVSIQGASSFTPTLRIPPKINLLFPQIKRIGDSARAEAEKTSTRKPPQSRRRKLNKLCLELKQMLLEAVPCQITKAIDPDYLNIKLITDAPLEWLPINDIPLMIKYDVSRLPSTPGNVLFMNCCTTSTLNISIEAFSEILILRSYTENDPVRNLISDQVSNMSMGAFKIDVKIVDIKNENDLILALNDYEGALVIFDCHGSHDTATDIGGINLQDGSYDIWALNEQTRVPPIVILSSCDTHPMDRSHASTANGFLKTGAYTVVATMLPVDALYAADFIRRLIWRLSEYLPLIHKVGKHPMPWSHIVSGLQRMTYITEILHTFQDRGANMSNKQYKEIHSECNMYINAEDNDWFQKSTRLISTKLEMREEDVLSIIKGDCNYLDILKYIQLGHPEKIHIYPS